VVILIGIKSLVLLQIVTDERKGVSAGGGGILKGIGVASRRHDGDQGGLVVGDGDLHISLGTECCSSNSLVKYQYDNRLDTMYGTASRKSDPAETKRQSQIFRRTNEATGSGTPGSAAKMRGNLEISGGRGWQMNCSCEVSIEVA
jgi:hypothetical protein